MIVFNHTANVFMEIYLWVAIGILLFTVICLTVKILLMKKSMKEIETELKEHFEVETNTVLGISSADKNIRQLTQCINEQLNFLRDERHRFQQGDMELKNAITNISHDLRTPLTAICGYLDLLEREEKSENVSRYLKIIENRTEMLKQLTEEFFRYTVIMSADSNMDKEEIEINSVLEESIAGYYASLKSKGIEPDISITKNPVTRNLNKEALSRVFGNIINNAIKYSDGDLFISFSDSGKIIFENTAKGLDEVQVGKLFDRFYTVEAARKSTGLGLAIAKNFVEQMNGKISAEYFENKLKIQIEFE